MAQPMKPPFRIEEIGVSQALQTLVPFVRSAGQLAKALQPQIAHGTEKTEKGGSPFASALTDADLLLEDRFGADLLMHFADASFHGEEHAMDRITRYIPKGRPFVVTLDPVNSTLTYRDGLPLYEVIVTICDREWTMLGSIVYRPAYDQVYIAYDWKGQKRAMYTRYEGDACVETMDLSLERLGAPKTVYLDRSYGDKADLVRRAGYEPVFPWRDYAGQRDWPHASCDVLTGACRGILNPRAQIIDAKAIGFIARMAGGIWEAGPLDLSTLKYTYGLSASDAKTAALLRSLI